MAHLAVVTEGMPGPAYHGGAVAVWAVLNAMLTRGHRVSLVSLWDRNPDSPYGRYRDEQLARLTGLEIPVSFVDYDSRYPNSIAGGPGGPLGRLVRLFDYRNHPVWRRFDGIAAAAVAALQPDGIYCYHFETVCALGPAPPAPVTVTAVDLLHLPVFWRWSEQPPSLAKYTRDALVQWGVSVAMKRMMIDLFRRCAVKVDFAPHYVRWFRRQPGCADTLYLRTPVHDPAGPEWHAARGDGGRRPGGAKPRILMIGDITGTATAAGLRLCRDTVFPILAHRLGEDGFEVHLVGGGTLLPEFAVFHRLPYVKLRGRIVPPDPEFLAADLVLVPTPHTLGVRVRILNAFSYGCPVVTHVGNQAGIPEMVHEDNALIAATGEGLAEGVLRILGDEALARRLGANGRTTFERHFSADTAGTAVVEALEASLAGHPQAPLSSASAAAASSPPALQTHR